MVVFCVMAAGAAAAHVATVQQRDRYKMATMETYSRKAFSVPKRLVGIPKALGKRAITARSMRLSNREVLFHEDSSTLYAQSSSDANCTFFTSSSTLVEVDVCCNDNGNLLDDDNDDVIDLVEEEKAEVVTDSTSEASNDRRYEIYEC